MVIIEHKQSVPLKLLNSELRVISTLQQKDLVSALITVSELYPNDVVLWCEASCLQSLNLDEVQNIFHHDRILVSYNPTSKQYLTDSIGYVERSFFVNINKNVSYPTWLMSSVVGGIHAKLVNHLHPHLKHYSDFDYMLNSVGKLGMATGLFCYSEPKLLKHKLSEIIKTNSVSTYTLFKFVKQHYKWFWVYFLALCILTNEKKLKVLPLIKSFFYKRLPTDFGIQNIDIQSLRTTINNGSYDVVIPTIGRKKYLYDILKDLNNQTVLPENVIIVEQNPLPNSISELDYLKTEDWKFKIKHTFTNTLGVCNARNLALKGVESEWTFLADDDIRITNTFFEDSLREIKKYGITVLNYLCLQPKQKQHYFETHQTSIFGSGSSLVKSEALGGLNFDTSYEFGFGEDSDFGMQLRNTGEDVIFIPNIKITHLKAPIGGYRTKVKQLWDTDIIQPKPSPTIQLLYQTYFMTHQIRGYKLLLFLKQLKTVGFKTPFTFSKRFNKQWQRSVFWSRKLKQKHA